jgi:hypothetical protein
MDDEGYVTVPKLPEPRDVPKGIKCGECGMKFDYGKAYGYCCPNTRCPCGWGPR